MKNTKPKNFKGSLKGWNNGANWARQSILDNNNQIYTCIPSKNVDYCSDCYCNDCPFK